MGKFQGIVLLKITQRRYVFFSNQDLFFFAIFSRHVVGEHLSFFFLVAR